MFDLSHSIVTVDLDSCMADTAHRQHMIDRENGTDWHAYSAACADDTPVTALVTLVQLLSQTGVEVHALSGRKASALPQTVLWFDKHEIPVEHFWLDETDVGDYVPGRTHEDYKIKRLREIEEITKKKVILHVDDWAKVAVKFEANGIPVLCVRTPQEIKSLTKPGYLG